MKLTAHFIFLGTGGSMGIPIVGCSCPVCLSKDQNNRRLRPSALIRVLNRNILIDCGPDFRQQALRAKIPTVEGIIMTHAHYDHIGGFDDLRGYYMKTREAIPVLLSEDTAADIKKRFDYIFDESSPKMKILPKIKLEILEGERGEVVFQGLKLRYLTYEQMGMKVNGFVCGNLAYISDIRHYPDTLIDDLKGVDILILSALRMTPSPVHFTVDEAVEFAGKVGAKQTWLTHIAHELDHEKTNAYLPANVRMAYDGLDFEFIAEVSEE